MTELLISPLAARNIPAGLKSVVIHAYGSWLDAIKQQKHDFFVKLSAQLEERSMRVHLVEGNSRTSQALLQSPHLHIIVGGPAMFGPTILHAHPSYIWGFWYLDELGFGWESSLRFAKFCPADVDREQADYFYNGVSSYMLEQNVSKLWQEPRLSSSLAPAAAVVFCQGIEHRTPRRHYLSTEQMIRTASTYDPSARVYVKPHPLQSKQARLRVMDIAAALPNVEIIDASVHDLIAVSDMVITQNSSTGFEALMQRKPVATCAKSDYWHATLTPRTESDLTAALSHGAETMRDFDYAGYFHWFLARNCLEPAKDDFATRAWARIRDKLMLI
ncbi:hypothetical protein [Celeribacter sp.]|uniref:capsular polysaccharide export protein, LipB/KpsS family n=1 Tax=Celeribacter sp. TaxID=1890673 RepID=UPI003A9146D6